MPYGWDDAEDLPLSLVLQSCWVSCHVLWEVLVLAGSWEPHLCCRHALKDDVRSPAHVTVCEVFSICTCSATFRGPVTSVAAWRHCEFKKYESQVEALAPFSDNRCWRQWNLLRKRRWLLQFSSQQLPCSYKLCWCPWYNAHCWAYDSSCVLPSTFLLVPSAPLITHFVEHCVQRCSIKLNWPRSHVMCCLSLCPPPAFSAISCWNWKL